MRQRFGYKKATGQVTNYSCGFPYPQQQLFDHVNTFVENKEGNFWVATKGGLGFFDVAKRHFNRKPGGRHNI